MGLGGNLRMVSACLRGENSEAFKCQTLGKSGGLVCVCLYDN
jgi:hypothetical protein